VNKRHLDAIIFTLGGRWCRGRKRNRYDCAFRQSQTAVENYDAILYVTCNDHNSIFDVRADKIKHTVRFAVSDLAAQAPIWCNPGTAVFELCTCQKARGLPVVDGATNRFALTYVDPKLSDGTPEEAATYDERCAQIAREMLYAFSTVDE
jgi:hypothetical protein